MVDIINKQHAEEVNERLIVGIEAEHSEVGRAGSAKHSATGAPNDFQLEIEDFPSRKPSLLPKIEPKKVISKEFATILIDRI